MAGKTPNKYENVTPTEFVEAWEAAKDIAEVSEKTGIPGPICAARASLYRSKGINLKKFNPGRKPAVSVAELNKLIEAMGGAPAATAKATPSLSPEELLALDEEKRKRNVELLEKLLGTRK
jgi:hypothetical protein